MVVLLPWGAGSIDAGLTAVSLDGVTLSDHVGSECQTGPLQLSRSGVVVNSEHSTTQDDAKTHSLYNLISKRSNLFAAWMSVRSRARTSLHEATRAEVAKVDEDPLKFVGSIQHRLSRRVYEFPPQRGLIKTKRSTGKRRGLIVAPIEGRVVQRAILNVLQSSSPQITSQLGDLRRHLFCPTSVGGIPERGAEYAVSAILKAIGEGHVHFVRSDIKAFFDTVDRKSLIAYLASQLTCKETSRLVEAALAVEFENPEEVRQNLSLFPSDTHGVPQGNSLSCLAANIALRDFDERLNGRGIVTIRYIDDFLILGKSRTSVTKAMASAKEILQEIGLDAYTPSERPDKAKEGSTRDGFSFIGCYFRDGTVSPSEEPRSRLLNETDAILSRSREAIKLSLREDKPRRAQDRFVQTLIAIDRKWRGWGDAFSFANDRECFKVLDGQLDDRLLNWRRWFAQVTRNSESTSFRRAFGVALLSDTPIPATDGLSSVRKSPTRGPHPAR